MSGLCSAHQGSCPEDCHINGRAKWERRALEAEARVAELESELAARDEDYRMQLDSPPFTPGALHEFSARDYERVNRASPSAGEAEATVAIDEGPIRTMRRPNEARPTNEQYDELLEKHRTLYLENIELRGKLESRPETAWSELLSAARSVVSLFPHSGPSEGDTRLRRLACAVHRIDPDETATETGSASR